MRRLAAAAGMAAALHGLLLIAGGPWLSTGRQAHVRPPRAVTLGLLETRGEPAPAASRAPEEKTAPKESPPVRAKPPGVRFSSQPSSPAASQRRSAALRSPAPPQVLSPGSTPARAPDIPEGPPEPPASTSQIHAPDSSPAPAPPEPRTSDARTASARDASGGPDLEAPVRPLKEAVPLYRENPPPAYPRVARRRGCEGTVLLEVLVTEKGRVGERRVVESSGHEPLDKAALQAVKDWRFSPGRRGNRAVAMRVLVPVRFQLQ